MTATIRATLASVAMCALLQTAWGKGPAPSFDCAKATSAAEKLICVRPALAEADVAVATLYQERRKALDADARALLVRDQMQFLATRDRVFEEGVGEPEALLSDLLTDRAEFLRGLAIPSASEFEGQWRHFGGHLRITPEDGGSLVVEIAGAEPLAARWICDGRATGRVVDGILEATVEDDGSTLRLLRNGDALEVTTIPPANDPDGTPRYCGLNGTATGAYFAVAPEPR